MGLFANTRPLGDPEVPFLATFPTGEADELRVDNPDGVVTANGIAGGPYGLETVDRGRSFSQGAGTEKGGRGNASGRATTMTLLGRRAGRDR